MYWFRIFVRCFVNLYDGAVLLLVTGRIGMATVCNFNCALSVDGEGFFCVRYFICRLSMIVLHCFKYQFLICVGRVSG
jgi:hypothetical protein